MVTNDEKTAITVAYIRLSAAPFLQRKTAIYLSIYVTVSAAPNFEHVRTMAVTMLWNAKSFSDPSLPDFAFLYFMLCID